MKVTPVGKNLSEVERAYIAGFLDGDGAIMATIEKHREKKFGFRVRTSIKITQKDPAVLRWLVSRVKAGNLRSNRTTYDWLVRNQDHVKILLTILLPHLRVKRRQAKSVLKILNTKSTTAVQFLKLAQSADALSKFNVRSKNRRRNSAVMIQESFSRND